MVGALTTAQQLKIRRLSANGGSKAGVLGRAAGPFDQLRRSYLLGTQAPQVARLLALQRAGCQSVVLGPTSHDPSQIELLVRLVLEPVAKAAPLSAEIALCSSGHRERHAVGGRPVR